MVHRIYVSINASRHHRNHYYVLKRTELSSRVLVITLGVTAIWLPRYLSRPYFPRP